MGRLARAASSSDSHRGCIAAVLGARGEDRPGIPARNLRRKRGFLRRARRELDRPADPATNPEISPATGRSHRRAVPLPRHPRHAVRAPAHPARRPDPEDQRHPGRLHAQHHADRRMRGSHPEAEPAVHHGQGG